MRCFLALAILSSVLTATGRSQAPFFPFEENGPFDDGGPVIWFPVGPFTSEYTDNALTLSNAPLLPGATNESLGLMVVLTFGPEDEAGNPTFPVVIGNDLSVEARVRLGCAKVGIPRPV